MSKISQNDLHFLHNSYTSQTYKIIGVNIELVILAFILLALDHANFECQHQVSKQTSPQSAWYVMNASVCMCMRQ